MFRWRIVRLLACFLLSLPLVVSAVDVSGVINFYDGKSIQFSNINSISYILKATNSYNVSPDTEGILVFFENSIRKIPFQKIKYFEIQKWEPWADVSINGTVKILTTTGMTIDSDYSLWSVSVKILDRLTGEIKLQDFSFINSLTKKINIISIEFNN